MVFKWAEQNDFFRGVQRIDSEILSHIRLMVSGLEVSARSTAEWESALLQGYAVWRELIDTGGGTVECNLDAGTIVVVHVGSRP